MTLREFFRKVRRRKWAIQWNGALRCEDGRCPLGAADDDLKGVPSFRGAAKLLGLPIPVARKIARAADMEKSRYRPWLLKNLGISVDLKG